MGGIRVVMAVTDFLMGYSPLFPPAGAQIQMRGLLR
jgi:hypothetical protein